MKTIPVLPESAPFSAEQRAWINGFLAGILQLHDSAQPATSVEGPPVVLLWGSQTGSAERLAKACAKTLSAKGFAARAVDMAKFDSVDLTKESRALVVTSTYGEGEPPDNAAGFWKYLSSEDAPRLEHLEYSVLALGDTNYSDFCQFGKLVDARFESLGAKRIHDRVDCDVDYEGPAREWLDGVLASISAGLDGRGSDSVEVGESAGATGHNKTNPFPSKLLTNRLLNAEGSAKEVRHFEFSLEGSGLNYSAGDALGVWPTNCPALVQDILGAIGCDGEEAVESAKGGETSLRHALLADFDITKPTHDLLVAASERGASEIQPLLDPASRDALKEWLFGRDVLDVLALMAASLTPQELLALLRKMQPRLYSISSSPKAHPNEVHLTVGVVRYQKHNRQRKGVCSSYLADRAGASSIPVFIQESHGFRPPTDGDRPIIMVGPGTGIAPFRAFLEERRATGAKGRNWLFFGDQREATDFYYRDELRSMLAEGSLNRLSTAFSRDQAEKIYVQDRMRESAPELWRWIEDGAHFYVCGDASRMAKDVDAALHSIIMTGGGLTAEAAAEYVQRLKSEKRYQRDVY